MSHPFIRIERQGGIARVTFDRPEKHNCISIDMWRELGHLFTGFDADEDLRCVVLAGAGGKAFSVGADIAEFPQVRKDAGQARKYGKVTHGALAAIATCRHPVVAAIQGLCVGGGLELASACDLRFCTEDSRFGVPVKRLGLVVAYPELQPLVRLVGPANAKEILLEGKVFDAGRAREMGLVNRVLPVAGFQEAIGATAASIAEGAPLVARWHKRFIGRLGDPRPLSDAELEESYNCFNTEDFRIGTEAFMNKTDPRFKGR
jgi:enoyl-CoA hydratase/carnithine racemase